MNKVQGCLRYWDQCSTITLDAAIALWCDVEPSELSDLNFSTSCMDAKRQIIVEALADKRLDYVDNGVQWSNGRHGPASSLEELIQKDGLRIKKESLRRFFLDMNSGERPAFLFDESRLENPPDGGELAEMNATKALAVMAWLITEKKSAMLIGGRPNAAKIGEEVAAFAKTMFGPDVRGFESFHKRLGNALKLLASEPNPGQKMMPWQK